MNQLTQTQKVYLAAIREEGLELVELKSNSGHRKCVVSHMGQEFKISIPSSANQNRSLMNFRTRLKRVKQRAIYRESMDQVRDGGPHQCLGDFVH